MFKSLSEVGGSHECDWTPEPRRCRAFLAKGVCLKAVFPFETDNPGGLPYCFRSRTVPRVQSQNLNKLELRLAYLPLGLFATIKWHIKTSLLVLGAFIMLFSKQKITREEKFISCMHKWKTAFGPLFFLIALLSQFVSPKALPQVSLRHNDEREGPGTPGPGTAVQLPLQESNPSEIVHHMHVAQLALHLSEQAT